jgi:DinB superfamily
MRRMGLVLAGFMVSGMALAQAPAPPAQPSGPAAEVQGSYGRLKPFVIKAAQDMPAEDYTFKPTPEIRTFARVVNHVIEAQFRGCGSANHVDPSAIPKPPADTADKATIVAALQASFAECDKAYAALTDANAMELVPVGQAKRTRIGLAWGNVSHDNEQYATLALYMRLKGLVPPSSEK